jgi:uncharacterized protein (TIRG00374 family)
VAVGIILLALVIWYADPRALARKLAATDLLAFGLACAIAIAANLASALRWATIARALGLIAPTLRLIPMYARGITTNVLLPGATLSGDLLRSYQLSGLGNPFLRAALSVFFDRFSGLWVLCALSLLALAALALGGKLSYAVGEDARLTVLFALPLAAIVALPLVPWPTQWLRGLRARWPNQLAERVDALRERVRASRPALLRSVGLSLAVQALSAGALWMCGQAVGVQLSYWAVLAAAGPIFVMGALPLGVAGFGTREVGAVLALGFFGVPAELATATSLLYGLTAVVQGLLAAPLFLFRA